jgi:hypothetical protein
VLAALFGDREAMMASRKRATREWTAVGAARAAREARIATVEFFREAPIARSWQASKLLGAYQVKVAHLGGHQAQAAALLLFTGMGYAESWRPGNWIEAAEQIPAMTKPCACGRSTQTALPRVSAPSPVPRSPAPNGIITFPA